jgi:hypothetical protein
MILWDAVPTCSSFIKITANAYRKVVYPSVLVYSITQYAVYLRSLSFMAHLNNFSRLQHEPEGLPSICSWPPSPAQ